MSERALPKNRLRRAAMGVALLAGVGVIGLYAVRKPIARNWIDSELKTRGVAGTYQLTQLDPDHQRLEHVVIGDPAHPDLTADWVETETHVGLFGASLRGVRAGGVRVHGVLDKDGALHFGALDKFRTGGGPFKLPDLGLDLSDTRLALATPYGDVNARLDGKGNLARDFDGKLGVTTAAMRAGGCVVTPLDAQLSIQMRGGEPHLVGPVRSDSLACAGNNLTHAALNADVTLSRDLKGAHGRLGLTADHVTSPLLAKAAQSLKVADGTPLAAFGAQYGRAILALSGGMALNAAFSNDPAQGTVLSNISARSHSGAVFALADGGRVTISPAGKIGFDGQAALNGGGLPDTQFTAAGSAANFKGTATIAPLTAPHTRLALTPVTFSHDAHGTKIATTATFDGPVAGGAVRGLKLPIAGLIGAAGGFALTKPCTSVAFESLTLSGLALGKTATNVCLNGKDVRIAAPRLAGRYNGEAMALSAADAHYNLGSKIIALNALTGKFGATALAATSAQYSLASKIFSVAKINAAAGATGHQSTLTLDAINGTMNGSTASGKYTNASGRLPNVPLALEHSSGTWRFAQSALTLNGNLDIADTDPAKRFEPLVSHDVVLRYVKGVITADGTLNEPKSGAFISTVHISHTLATNSGGADINILDMPLLTFGKALQPDGLTRITLGVIANVKGSVSGAGHIHWNDKGVTSDGVFETQHMDLAAAFGPVYGLKGKINFTDLLGMLSAPNQVVTMASVNPGVVVNNGEVHYRLLPGNKVEIEGGTFPLAGGRLVMEPTVLDLTQAAERRMTFRVEGIDAAQFIENYKFEDIAATGTFDGELPLVFDTNGGRIEAGRLAVREAGGTVSYVGPVSNASLGRFGRLAFDALKSIKYHGLTIDLNGPLDGEMVTMVRLAGTNQAPISAQKNFLLKQITNIPFKFNIRIQAPFRSLFTSAKNLQDPSDMVQQTLPSKLKASAAPPAPAPVPPVHPPATSIQN